ncbi:two-component system, NtrC family, response regulator AtoC [Mariprofundus micogutta]|uniref:Two-component system, NtrC family, response regulator AtoC n=1 Tax=Mariprofundus micogutta TaxID=1921010 RepID=A0A1L8CM72_9PROT|nr:response regulator [Mariprofundus micogutta]GAV20018.1 two-component system, NtrC family, response regulator AtoC [Mariprofundus micogutta]
MARSRLLLAEDDDALASLLEEYLLEAEYDVVVHSRGDTALEALKQEHFDLLLSDIVMPGADGLTLLRYIHETPCDTLVILMTGYSGIENALHAVEQGAYDFVSKPFQLPEIRVRVDNAIRYQQLLRKWNEMTGETHQFGETLQKSGAAAVKAYGQSMTGSKY